MSTATLIQLDRDEGSHTPQAAVPKAATQNRRAHARRGAALWTVQTVLALLFLFAGGMKLVMPIAPLAAQSHLPGAFMRFIGTAEVLGAIGLILPGLVRIRPGLTPLAAAGLVIIMVGATTVTVLGGTLAPALIPFVVGLLASFVAYGRWRVVPLGSAR